MENLKEQINNDLKDSLRNKNPLVSSVLRMLLAAIKNKEISLRDGGDSFLSDEGIVEVVNSEIKKRKDSIKSYDDAGRKDLADKEREELDILGKYLPEQMSDEEIKKIVKIAIDQSGGADIKKFGQIMGMVTKQTKGKADGNRVSEIVKNILNS